MTGVAEGDVYWLSSKPIGKWGILLARYKVLLNGANFLFRVDGEPSRMGFYTTRFVTAESRETAELAAVELLREDPKLNGCLNDRTDPPMIYAEGITEVDADAAEDPAQHGFAFYAEEPEA